MEGGLHPPPPSASGPLTSSPSHLPSLPPTPPTAGHTSQSRDRPGPRGTPHPLFTPVLCSHIAPVLTLYAYAHLGPHIPPSPLTTGHAAQPGDRSWPSGGWFRDGARPLLFRRGARRKSYQTYKPRKRLCSAASFPKRCVAKIKRPKIKLCSRRRRTSLCRRGRPASEVLFSGGRVGGEPKINFILLTIASRPPHASQVLHSPSGASSTLGTWEYKVCASSF